MRAITDSSKLPKFLMVNEIAVNDISSKHLLIPWKSREIVQVDTNQEPDLAKTTAEVFKRNYVRVIRKGASGKFDCTYVESWGFFDKLK